MTITKLIQTIKNKIKLKFADYNNEIQIGINFDYASDDWIVWLQRPNLNHISDELEEDSDAYFGDQICGEMMDSWAISSGATLLKALKKLHKQVIKHVESSNDELEEEIPF